MTDEKMISVDLENTVGVSRGPYAGKLYGPGKGVKVPAGFAATLGLTASATSDASESSDPNADLADMTRDQLEAEATALEIDLADGKGENADGAYSVEQLRKKIARKRKAQ